jgi:hypothetical protein
VDESIVVWPIPTRHPWKTTSPLVPDTDVCVDVKTSGHAISGIGDPAIAGRGRGKPTRPFRADARRLSASP